MSAPAAEFSPVSLASQRLADELWVSFASLLRSHAAMRALAWPAAGLKVVSVSATHIEIANPSRRMRIAAPDLSSRGSIQSTANGMEMEDQRETFVFTDNGSVCFNKSNGNLQPMELEAAVEYLLDEVCR